MSDPVGPGPDLVIAGSARSGTTLLAAQLGLHPRIDAGAVKEPNFFSINYGRGLGWYDSYYAPRADGLVRLDASMSYTYPQHPEALSRLAAASPHATVVYVVRDAVDRAVSHYLLNRHYFGHEPAPDFGSALRAKSFYADVSDYGRWIDALLEVYPDRRVIVVPFEAVTASRREVARFLGDRLGLEDVADDERRVQAHQNNVVTFRSDAARRMTRRLRHSRAYPMVRRALGPYTVKRIRSVLTRVPDLPSVAEALASCQPAQRSELDELRRRAHAAVLQRLQVQDELLGLDWARVVHRVPDDLGSPQV